MFQLKSVEKGDKKIFEKNKGKKSTVAGLVCEMEGSNGPNDQEYIRTQAAQHVNDIERLAGTAFPVG